MKAQVIAAVGLVVSLAVVSGAGADVLSMGGMRNADGSWNGLASLETVPVGNPGNAGELSGTGAGGDGPDRICGAVDYGFNIGKYEVTAGQYCEFLNAVADSDTYALYNLAMDRDSGAPYGSQYGCSIKRSGSPGAYTYTVASDYANRPVTHIGWADAARFANWLHNGQHTGAQDSSTTEDGAYDLISTQQYYGPNGELPLHTSTDYTALVEALLAITRKADWKWAITNEDEWYKAAYYEPAMESYYDYTTRSDSMPGLDMTEITSPGNNANYSRYPNFIEPLYYTTVVGEFELSDSPYGTFDQGGNIWEWLEAVPSGQYSGMRGSAWEDSYSYMHSAARVDGFYPTWEWQDFGFRVVQAPEPASLVLLALGGLALIPRRRKWPATQTMP